MPYLKIETNQRVTDPRAVLKATSAAVAELLGKPEQYVMVALHGETPMLFGGNDAPLVYLELKSIGLPETATGDFSAQLATLMGELLGVPKDRIYIEFADAPRHLWGYNGGTF